MTVQVRYLGHLGNNLFEYALGRIIAEGLGQELVCLPAQDTPGWSQVEAMSGIRDRLTAHWRDFLDAPQEMIGAKFERPTIRYVYGEVPGWSGHGINLDYILRHGHGHKVILHGYFQRIQYYHPHRERIRSWFRFRESHPKFEVRPDDVVVHLRQSPDMFILNRAISLNYYRDILSGLSFGRVLVCGLGLGDQVKAALMPFNPVYLDLSAIETLKLLTRAQRIVLANSTFSWWGAYLSDASEVYYPRVVRGFWGADWGEVDLEVPDVRYRYIEDVDVQTWRPFQWPVGTQLTVSHRDGETLQLNVCGKSSPVFRAKLPASFEPLCAWLALRDLPFGLMDLNDVDLPAGAHNNVLMLVGGLCRAGLLRAEPNAVEALAGLYPMTRTGGQGSPPR